MKQTLLLLALALIAARADAKSKPVISDVQTSGPMPTKIQPATPIGDPASWFSSDDYPAEAMRNGGTGTVNATLAIDETGKVTDCSVTESSGNQTLDDATCALLMVRARFSPGHDAKGQPIATSFHRQIRWAIPTGNREIWTLDQIRFPPPKDSKSLTTLTDDHSMDAVVKRLKALGITFERSPVELDTAELPPNVVAEVNNLPATEPFVIPKGGTVTISVMTARRPAIFDGTAARPFPLPSPISTQLTLSFDVDADGNSSNCQVKGEGPPWAVRAPDPCKAMEMGKLKFSPNPAGPVRHVVQTVQTRVTPAESKPPPAPVK